MVFVDLPHMVEEADIKKSLEFPKTKVTAIDRDNFVAGDAKNSTKKIPKRFDFHQKKFSEVHKVINHREIDKVV